MKNLHLMLMLLLATACMPDSLTKFKEEPVKKAKAGAAATKNITLPDGSVVTIPSGPTATTTAPTSFDYSTTEIIAYLNEPITASVATITPSTINSGVGFYLTASATGCGSAGTTPIASSFPSDLTLNPNTGAISGTATSFSLRQAYYIKMLHISTGTVLCKTIFITKLTKIKSFKYLHAVGDNLILKLSTFGDTTILSNNSFYSADYLTDPRYIVTNNAARAKINFVDWTNKLLYVTVTEADTTYDLTNPEYTQLDKNSTIDVGETSTSLYFAQRAIITDVTQVFKATQDFKTVALAARLPVTDPYIAPSSLASSEWSTFTFSIGPNIGADSTIDFDTSSSFISTLTGGELRSATTASVNAPINTKPSTNYALTLKDASGANFNSSYQFSIVMPPQNFALTRWQLLKIDNAAKFLIGDKISSTNNLARGQVRQVVSRRNSKAHMILVEVEVGIFGAGNSIDNVSPYYGEKTFIVASYPVNAVIRTSHTNAWGAALDGVPAAADAYFSTSSGDKGIVQYVVNNTAADNYMYVTITKGQLSIGEGIDDVETHIADETIILEVDSAEIQLTTASNTGFSVGTEVTDAAGAIGLVDQVTGAQDMYINNTLKVQTCSNSAITAVSDCEFATATWDMNGFSAGGTEIDNLNYFTAPGTTTISTVSTYNAFNIFREDNITIQPFLYRGNEVFYELVGTLPTGLVFDKSNGQISGIPIEFSATKNLSIRAYNAASDFTSLPTADFDLKITEHFEIINETDNATSFILHKEGQGRVRSRCMITQEQIDGTDQAAKDIICYVDAGELDLYKSGLKLKANVGKGICEHFQYFPYYFYQYQYKNSIPTDGAAIPSYTRRFKKIVGSGCVASSVANVGASAATATELANEQFCASDYSKIDKDYPNCDTGSYELETVTYAETICTSETKLETIKCDGKKSKCVAGPAKQDGLDTDFYNSVITSSDLGLNQVWNYAAPITKGYGTNLSLANYVTKNKCDVDITGNVYAYTPQYWGDHINDSYNRLTQYTDPFMQSNPFYTFACLDSGFDIRARIRIMVRDWDKDFKMTEGIDRSNPKTLCSGYVASGTCGAALGCYWNTTTNLCLSAMDNNAVDAFGNNYNNRVDWDDVGAVLPGTCSAPAGGAGGLINITPNPDTTNFTTQFAFPGGAL